MSRATSRADEPGDERAGLCSYHLGELWCPLPGVHAEGGAAIRGPGRWYCWLHHENRPQADTLAVQDLQDIINRQGELRAEHRHRELDEERERRIAANPHWKRAEHESSSGYAHRMLAEMRRLVPRVSKPLPYDPGRSLAGEDIDYDRLEREAIQAEADARDDEDDDPFDQLRRLEHEQSSSSDD